MIIPYLSFLVTALDVKVELECVLATTFKATVVPTVGVSTYVYYIPLHNNYVLIADVFPSDHALLRALLKIMFLIIDNF